MKVTLTVTETVEYELTAQVSDDWVGSDEEAEELWLSRDDPNEHFRGVTEREIHWEVQQ